MLLANDNLYELNDLITKVQSNGFSSFSEFSDEVIQIFNTGYDIDIWIPVYAINILKHRDISNFDEEILRIEVKRVDDYIKISKNSNGNFTDLSKGCFSAYNSLENFPITRIYTYNFKSADDIKYLSQHLDWSSFNKKNLDELIDKETVNYRIEKYLEKTDEVFKKIIKYTQGKIDNTSLTGGIVIARQDNICAICNEQESTEIEEIAFTNFESGIQTSFEVCKDCISKTVEENQILKLMFQDTDIFSLLNKKQLSIEDVRKISNNIVKTNLGCEVNQYATNTNDTITAFTKSGSILKLRLTTLSDYGYMIFNSKGTELIRFDSANHHDDKIEFLPHHVHNNIVQENKIKLEAEILSRKKAKEHKQSIDITDSFLSGFLGIDYISIKNKILEVEKS